MLSPLDFPSTTSAIWDGVLKYYLFLGTSAAIIVIGWMIYSISANRAKNVKEAPRFHEEGDWGNWKRALVTLMITGTVLGFVEYQTFASAGLITPPASQDALHVSVIARQFSWTFVYPNGMRTFSNLTVPENTVVILNITSLDVDHSLAIPDFNVAKDAIPGQYNVLWFNATSTGTHLLDCKELCGVGHAFMTGTVTVVTPQAYNAWYSAQGGS